MAILYKNKIDSSLEVNENLHPFRKRERKNNQEKVAGRIKGQQRSKHRFDRGRRGDDKH